ncbi:DUF3168 domain-containing protein [Ottowia sp. GY511]|uniref:DUF3168 domain-containing protein n=1 Tax=Ottowia flava TaxID=2675430 RepID=A0ABW4KPF7_9BURK|nr:DUF3168 domain-containing protein [Ottowia sp. GY511]TXK26371.1 DUF3168 domain-containing protein [Ottowia sp. GY511]
MAFEADFLAALKAQCPYVFAGMADATVPASKPYVVFTQVGGPVVNYVENSQPNLQQARIQVTVWAPTTLQANSISRAIERALRAATAFTARPLAAFDADHDPDTGRYGARQDFMCSYPDP